MENPFEVLHQEIRQLRGLVTELLARPVEPVSQVEKPIFIKDAAALLNLSTSAVYKSIDTIPHVKKHGQYYFFASQLLDYLKAEKPKPAPKTIELPKVVRRRKTEPNP